MDARLTYDEDALNYDKYRPTYCKEIYDCIFEYSGLSSTGYVLEIGIGTGKASKPILESGCHLSAIELGEKLALFTGRKFEDYKNFEVCQTSFEDYECESDSYDMVYSATAFHWIPQDVGYSKVYDLLKVRGTFALFWNRPCVGSGELYKKIEHLYKKWAPHIDLMKYMADNSTFDSIQKALLKYGFSDIRLQLFRRTRTYTAEDYISLLNTYSYHIALDDSIKTALEDEIVKVINEFGGEITIQDTMDLHLGRKQ